MGPEALAQVLQPLTHRTHPDLLVGLQTSDDAAVYLLSDDLAIIQTIDFFTPIVDDPYTYGAIAATNSMSDIYAMGGEVLFALNVAAFPETLPPSVLSDILRGGAAKVEEAGGVIAGGHTVTDNEPKYGLAVTGRIHPGRILRKQGACPGDRLFLTKPIGTGIVATAIKRERADQAAIAAATSAMLTLNGPASRLISALGATSCTDITGFGLLGHAQEVAERSSVRLEIVASRVPLLPSALDYATAGLIPGGLRRNRDYYQGHGVELAAGIGAALESLLFDPQTSGGLLFTAPEANADRMRTSFSEAEIELWEIGAVVAGAGIAVLP